MTQQSMPAGSGPPPSGVVAVRLDGAGREGFAARWAPFIIVAIALLSTLATMPRGEFPLNDDWAYAQSVAWLLGEHRIRLSDWVGMNLLPQTLAGAAVSAIAGFSFEALRHLTQAAAVGVALLAFRWFVAIGLARASALLATLVLIAMPCWAALANTFMTDLYVLLFALPAATLFWRALRHPQWTTLLLATTMAAAGVLQRQVAVVVPAAFLVAMLAGMRTWRLRTFVVALAPLAAVLAAAYAYHAYLAYGPGVPEAQQYLHHRLGAALVNVLANEGGVYREWVLANLLAVVGYLGLFAAPWVLWLGLPSARAARAGVLIVATLAALAIASTGFWPPFRDDNLIDAAGIGPFTLYDAQPRGLAPIDRSPGILWRVAGVASAFGAAALLRVLLVSARAVVSQAPADRSETVFLLAVVVGYLAPFVITDFFDRYLLFAMPFLLALVARGEPTRSQPAARAVALAWTMAAIGLAAMATHDYFAWNRARWAAIRTAEAMGATPETMDGGFEYNAYHRFELRPRVHPPGRSWWFVHDDRYVIAFTVVPGYTEVARFEVDRWLSRTPQAVRLLERRSP